MALNVALGTAQQPGYLRTLRCKCSRGPAGPAWMRGLRRMRHGSLRTLRRIALARMCPRVKQQSLCNPRGAAARSISISVKRRRPWRGHSPKLGTSKKHCVQFKSSPDPPPDKGRSPFNPAGNVPFAYPSNPPAPHREAERTNPPPLSWHPLADRGPGQGPLSPHPPTSGGIAGPSPAPLAAGPWGEVRR